jgi:hypothetical protein
MPDDKYQSTALLTISRYRIYDTGALSTETEMSPPFLPPPLPKPDANTTQRATSTSLGLTRAGGDVGPWQGRGVVVFIIVLSAGAFCIFSCHLRSAVTSPYKGVARQAALALRRATHVPTSHPQQGL